MRQRKYKDELQDGHFLTTIVTKVNSVTEMLNSLGWPTLESRRQLYQYIIQNNASLYPCHTSTAMVLAICQHNIQQGTSISTILYCQLAIQLYSAYQQSFFPKTINQWNNLPNNIIESSSIQHFVAAIANCRTTGWQRTLKVDQQFWLPKLIRPDRFQRGANFGLTATKIGPAGSILEGGQFGLTGRLYCKPITPLCRYAKIGSGHVRDYNHCTVSSGEYFYTVPWYQWKSISGLFLDIRVTRHAELSVAINNFVRWALICITCVPVNYFQKFLLQPSTTSNYHLFP